MPSILSACTAFMISTTVRPRFGLLIEIAQRRGDARAARPVGHRGRAAGERLVGVTLTERSGDISEPRAEQKRRYALSRVGEVVQKVQEDAAVLAHRARDIEQRDERRGLCLRPDEAQIDEIAAALHAGAQRAPNIDEITARMRLEPAGADFGERQNKALHRLLGGGDLGTGHLRKIFVLQTSRSDTVIRASSSTSRSFFSLSSRPENSASRMRVAPACGACGTAGDCGSIIASN